MAEPRRRHPGLPAQTEQPPKRPLVTEQSILQSSPWLPVPYELADVMAIKALAAGTAEKEQQLRAMRWILVEASGRLEMSYRPGAEEGRRNTDFMEGRRFVGNQIVKLINTDPAKVQKREPRADPHEPGS